MSTAEGSEPLWTRGGRELVYRKGDSVFAVATDLEQGRSGVPALLFALFGILRWRMRESSRANITLD